MALTNSVYSWLVTGKGAIKKADTWTPRAGFSFLGVSSARPPIMKEPPGTKVM